MTLASNQYVLGDWGLSGVSTSNSNPVYLSLSADNPNYSDYELWAYSTASASWSEIVAPSATAPAGSTIANDLSFDGTSYGFSLTGARPTAAADWTLAASITSSSARERGRRWWFTIRAKSSPAIRWSTSTT